MNEGGKCFKQQQLIENVNDGVGPPLNELDSSSKHRTDLISKNVFLLAVSQVLVPKKSEFSGKMIEVEIYEAGKHFLKGRPVEDGRPFTPSIALPLQKGAVSGLTQVRGSSSLKRCRLIDRLRP